MKLRKPFSIVIAASVLLSFTACRARERYLNAIDSKIARGPVTIRVNKDNPGSIMNPSLRGTFGSVVLIAVFLLIGAFFVYGVLHGGVHGSSIGM